MKACITLGGGVRISPAAYLGALRLAMDNPTVKFNQSFQDPKGWMGPKTGAEIVLEYRRMVRDRHAEQWAAVRMYGKGSKAAKRGQVIMDSKATCKWCGSRIETQAQRFCDIGCAKSYSY